MGVYSCGECGLRLESENGNMLTEAMLFHHCPPICAAQPSCPSCIEEVRE